MTNNLAKILTIGMPTHNGARTIGKSILSLLNQTERRFQLVISDNASNDGTEEICRNLAKGDERIIYIRQRVNLGPIGNFNYVLDYAESDYFMWACDDDAWDQCFVEKLIKILNSSSEWSFSIPSWHVRSRRFPGVRRVNLPSLDFISDLDPEVRVWKFTSLPHTSFKDNMTFGVWRTEALKAIMHSAKDNIKYYSIGGPLNEYTLGKVRGVQLNEYLFSKYYKTFPPGHFLEKVILFLKKTPMLGWKIPFAREYPRYTFQEFSDDIRWGLLKADFDERFIKRVIEINRAYW